MHEEHSRAAALVRQLELLRNNLVTSDLRLLGGEDDYLARDVHQQRLVAIVEASKDAIWSWNREGIIDSWNAEAARLFQYSADEIIGQSLLLLVPPERMDQARTAIKNLLRGEWYERYETVRLRKDGTPVPVELTVSPIKGRDGAVTGVATICRDISARVRQEEALRASEARYRAAVITGRIGAWQTNMVTRTRAWTAEACNCLALTCPRVAGSLAVRTTNSRRRYTPTTNI